MTLLNRAASIRYHPVTAGVMVLLIGLIALEGIITPQKNSHMRELRDSVDHDVAIVTDHIQMEVNSNIYLANGLVAFIAVDRYPNSEEITTAMRSLYQSGRNLKNIALAPGNKIEFVFPYAGNESVVGLYYPDLKEQWPDVKKAIDSRKTTVSGPINLIQGGTGLISRTPVYLDDGSYWGILSLVVDVDQVMMESGINLLENELKIAVRTVDVNGVPGDVFFGDPKTFENNAVIHNLTLPGLMWQVAATPSAGWDQILDSLRKTELIWIFLIFLLSVAAWKRQKKSIDLFRTVKRLASIATSIRDAIIMTDTSGRVIEANVAAIKMFGSSGKKLQMQNISDLVQIDALPDEFTGQEVVRGWRLDGEGIWLEVGRSSLDVLGRHKKIYSIRDVSDRFAIESALRESEKWFRSITSQVPGVIFQWQEGPGSFRGFSYVSDRSGEILGVDAKALVADHGSLKIHPDDSEIWTASIWHSMETGEDCQFEGRYLRDGETRWWRAFARPQHEAIEEDGAIHFMGVIFDITHIKSSEQDLIAKERELAAVLESALDGIISIDMYGAIRSANAAAGKIFGYDPDELVGQNVSMLMPASIARRHDSYLAAATQSGVGTAVGTSRMVTGQRRNGELVPIELSVSELTSGHSLAFTGVLRDITERVRAESELEAARMGLEQKAKDLELLAHELDGARREAEQASEAKSNFLAIMSHELRTPLTGILGISDLLLAEEKDSRHRNWVRTLRGSGVTLLSLLDDILDFSKIEAGMLDLEEISFRPYEVLSDVHQLLSGKASGKGLDFQVERRVTHPHVVKGDPTRLQQVLLNIASNALKFTENGSVTLSLSEALDLGDGRHRFAFEVADTGIGIPEDVQARLFQPFMQAEASTTRRFGGTGLGLVISRRLAEAMDGEITLQSTVGEGSVFRISVIFLDSDETNESLTSVESGIPTDARDRPLKILIAEDNETNRLLLNDALSMAGHSVVSVENGAKAVAALQQDEFDAVIMDMQMPVMDGLTAARKIRADTPDGPPIILLTADAIAIQSYEREEALSAVLTKPIEWPKLFRVLQHYAGKGMQQTPTRDLPGSEIGNDGPVSGTAERDESGMTSGETPVLALDQLDVLRASIPQDRIHPILESLMNKLDLYAGDLVSAIHSNDVEQAGIALHRIVGLSGQFGLSQVSAICEKIILPPDDEKAELSQTLAVAIDSAVKAAQTQIKAYAESLPSC